MKSIRFFEFLKIRDGNDWLKADLAPAKTERLESKSQRVVLRRHSWSPGMVAHFRHDLIQFLTSICPTWTKHGRRQLPTWAFDH
jgi:hypothetical protein